MKRLLAFIVLGLFWSHSVLAEPKKRSEKEIKMGVFLEDLKSIGTYKKIEQVPVGLFDKKYNSFAAQASYSLSQVGILFVKQKCLIDMETMLSTLQWLIIPESKISMKKKKHYY